MAKDQETPDEKITVSTEIDLTKNIQDLTLDELKTEHAVLKDAFTAKKSSGKASDVIEAKTIKTRADEIAGLVAEMQTLDSEVSELPEAPVAEEETPEVPEEETPDEDEAPVAQEEVVMPEPELVMASAETPSEEVPEVKVASAVYTASAASEGQFTIGQSLTYKEIGGLLEDTLKSGVKQKTRIANKRFDGAPIIKFTGDAEENLRKVLAARAQGQEGSATARSMGYDDSFEARTAAWGCDPADVDRTVISCVTRGRPVAEIFPTVIADRLNLKFPGKATYNIGGTATSGTNLISTRTSGSTAITYSDRATWKTILDLTCGEEEDIALTEFIAALRVTEQQLFSSPETVNEAISRLDAQLDINMERALLTLLDTKITLHTTTNTLASNSISRAIAQEIWQIEQNGNFTNVDDYVAIIPAGLLNLMYADQAGRANPPEDIAKFANELINVHGLRTVVTRGGTDPSLTITAQSNGAIPALPTAWPIRIINPDNFRLIHGPETQLSVESVPADLESLLTNSSAFFARAYEGLIDVGKCVQGKVTVTVPLDSASRIAAATTI